MQITGVPRKNERSNKLRLNTIGSFNPIIFASVLFKSSMRKKIIYSLEYVDKIVFNRIFCCWKRVIRFHIQAFVRFKKFVCVKFEKHTSKNEVKGQYYKYRNIFWTLCYIYAPHFWIFAFSYPIWRPTLNRKKCSNCWTSDKEWAIAMHFMSDFNFDEIMVLCHWDTFLSRFESFKQKIKHFVKVANKSKFPFGL